MSARTKSHLPRPALWWKPASLRNWTRPAARIAAPAATVLLTVAKPWLADMKKMEGDLVLQEFWRIQDTLSASYGHDVDRLFAEARERQKLSGHPVVNLQRRRKKAANAKA